MPNRCISLLPGLILCVFREYKSQLLETVLTLMESISLNQLMLFWKTAKLEQVLTLSYFFPFVKIPYLSLSHLFVVRTRIEMKLKSDCGAISRGWLRLNCQCQLWYQDEDNLLWTRTWNQVPSWFDITQLWFCSPIISKGPSKNGRLCSHFGIQNCNWTFVACYLHWCKLLLFSIGSLGKDNSTGIVTKVVLDTAFLKETTNGLRIKTWQVMLYIMLVNHLTSIIGNWMKIPIKLDLIPPNKRTLKEKIKWVFSIPVETSTLI